MDENKYRELHAKTVVELRRMARELGLKIPSGYTKAQIVEKLAQTPEDGYPSTARAEQAAHPEASAEAREGVGAATTELQRPVEKRQEVANAAAAKSASPAREAVPPAEGDPVASGENAGRVRGTLRGVAARGAMPQPHRDVRTVNAAPRFRGEPAARTGESDRSQRVERVGQPEGARPVMRREAGSRPAPGIDGLRPVLRSGSPDDAVRPAVRNEFRDNAARPVAGNEAMRPTARGEAVEGSMRPATRVNYRDGAGRTSAGNDGVRTAEYRDAGNRPVQGDGPMRPAEYRDAGSRPVQSVEPQRPAARGEAAEAGIRPQARPEYRVSGGRMGVGRPVQRAEGHPAPQPRPVPAASVSAEPRRVDEERRPEPEAQRPRPAYGEYNTANPAVPEMIANGECREGGGVLELMPDGYGFLRAENYTQGPNDIYVAINQIRRFNLRTGDYVKGKTRAQREGDRYEALLYITEINGRSPEEQGRRVPFENMTPVYPDERIRLEDDTEAGRDLALRTIDLFAPIGKGQRGLIVSQPKAGKTVLLKKIANSITRNHPEIHLIVLLIDERPEEVTDMRRSISGEVVSSTFDEAPENHCRVADMVFGRAQRLVENGRDVVILMDSITRLARAYNLVNPPTGRSLSGGLDPGALRQPKRFFGAARNLENGGSLTVIATALVETGSRMDDIIYEEFKGTGNMEIHLNRKLSERRIFPAIDIEKSGTRRDELLLTEREQSAVLTMRRLLNGDAQEITEQLIDMMSKTLDNDTFLQRIEGWAQQMNRK